MQPPSFFKDFYYDDLSEGVPEVVADFSRVRALLEAEADEPLDERKNESDCPVCGYHLGFRPWIGHTASFKSCPCCGIEFGYDDTSKGRFQGTRGQIYAQWRADWILWGTPWHDLDSAPPNDWNPIAQLAGLL